MAKTVSGLDYFRSPKRSSDRISSKLSPFPYYAGYSEAFTEDVLKKYTSSGSSILDPWNGSGTTTTVSSRLGLNSTGVDLNPTMVFVAKARASNLLDTTAAEKAWTDISSALTSAKICDGKNDPLLHWYGVKASSVIRSAVNKVLQSVGNPTSLDQISTSAQPFQALIIIAIIRVTKNRLKGAIGSNPTWTKKNTNQRKLSLPVDIFCNLVSKEIENLSSGFQARPNSLIKPKIACMDSRKMDIPSESIDFILTSPPYCTRIDYAVSTLYELAVLGMSPETVREDLRPELMGTTTIKSSNGTEDSRWGNKCIQLLSIVQNHPSHGSRTYYYKNLKQYFSSLYASTMEIERVLKTGGKTALVVQSSFYKEHVIDLAGIVAEMASNSNLKVIDIFEFPIGPTMARVNTKSSRYRAQEVSTEQLLVLEK